MNVVEHQGKQLCSDISVFIYLYIFVLIFFCSEREKLRIKIWTKYQITTLNLYY